MQPQAKWPSATGFFERLCHLLIAHFPTARTDLFRLVLTDLWSFHLPGSVRFRHDLCVTATEPEGLSVIDAGPCSDPTLLKEMPFASFSDTIRWRRHRWWSYRSIRIRMDPIIEIYQNKEIAIYFKPQRLCSLWLVEFVYLHKFLLSIIPVYPDIILSRLSPA